MSKLLNRPWTDSHLILAGVLFLLLTGNFTFFNKLGTVYPLTDNAVFLASLLVFHGALLFLTFTLTSLVVPVRLILSLAFVLSATAGYYLDQLGTVIDDTMIRNVVETNVAEALDLINSGLILRVLLLGILPAVLIWFLPLRKRSWWKVRALSLATASVSLLVGVAVVFPLSGQYASFFREHKPLRFYANPLYPIYSVSEYLQERLQPKTRQFQLLTRESHTIEGAHEHELIVLVVGETARAGNFSLNGYERKTTPLLDRDPDVISFAHFSSCGTSTAISVPCMFSFEGREDFDVEEASRQQNVLDVLQMAGVNVLWRDNNSDSKGVALRVPYEDFKSPQVNPVCDEECRDVGMLDGLQDYVDGHEGDILIVLHQMGSHGPAYYKRYPPQFEHFRPACHSRELSDCSREEVVNAYDNTILYTDYFLSQVIDFLKANSGYETAMLYLGDHGESLGENGLYLHGVPYMIAPREQTRVPFIAWVGPTSDIDKASMRRLASAALSQDSLSRALLEAFEVSSDLNERVGEFPPLFARTHEQPLMASSSGKTRRVR